MRWLNFDELTQLTSDESTVRLAKVGFQVAKEQFRNILQVAHVPRL